MRSLARRAIRAACLAAPLVVAALVPWPRSAQAACAGALDGAAASAAGSPVTVRAIFSPDVVVELCDVVAPSDGSYAINWLRDGALAFSKQVYLTAGAHRLAPVETFSWPASDPGTWEVEIVDALKQRVVERRSYVIDADDHAVRKNANVRRAPATSAARLTTLPSGTRVHVLGQKGDWLRVALTDGRTGFIFAELVESRKPKARRVTIGQRYLIEGHPLDFACETVDLPVTEVSNEKTVRRWTNVIDRCQARATSFYYDADGAWVDIRVGVVRQVLNNNHPERGFVEKDQVVRIEFPDSDPIERHFSYEARSVSLSAGPVAVRVDGDALTIEKTDLSATESRWQRWLSGADRVARRYKDCRRCTPEGQRASDAVAQACSPAACETELLETLAKISCALNVNVRDDNRSCHADAETLIRAANINVPAVE